MTRQLLAVPALLSTAVLLLAACGSDEDAKAEYVEQATAICSEAKAELDAQERPATPEGFAPYVQRVVEIGEDAAEQLLALEPPEDDRAELEQKLLDPLAAQLEEGREYAAKVEAAGTDTSKLLPLLGQVPDTGDIDLAYAQEYGLSACTELIPQS
jgi:protein-tyrosine-phosphatase